MRRQIHRNVQWPGERRQPQRALPQHEQRVAKGNAKQAVRHPIQKKHKIGDPRPSHAVPCEKVCGEVYSKRGNVGKHAEEECGPQGPLGKPAPITTSSAQRAGQANFAARSRTQNSVKECIHPSTINRPERNRIAGFRQHPVKNRIRRMPRAEDSLRRFASRNPKRPSRQSDLHPPAKPHLLSRDGNSSTRCARIGQWQ